MLCLSIDYIYTVRNESFVVVRIVGVLGRMP
jgi:hypothetical protein